MVSQLVSFPDLPAWWANLSRSQTYLHGEPTGLVPRLHAVTAPIPGMRVCMMEWKTWSIHPPNNHHCLYYHSEIKLPPHAHFSGLPALPVTAVVLTHITLASCIFFVMHVVNHWRVASYYSASYCWFWKIHILLLNFDVAFSVEHSSSELCSAI